MIRSDGQFVRDYFYVEDGATAYMTLAEALAARPELAGEAFNFSNEIQVTVLDLVRQILRLMESDLEPDVRNEASNEIVHQYLSAAKARQRPGLDARGSTSTRACAGRSTGTGSSLLMGSDRADCPPGRDPRPGAAISRRGLPARTFVPGESPVPCAGRVFDDEELASPGRCLARLLADHRPLRRAVRARVRPPVRRPPRPARQLRLVGQPRRPLGPDLAEAGRPAAPGPATRSSPSPPASRRRSIRSSRTASCRSSSTSTCPTYNIDVTQLEAALLGPDARDHGRPHARQSVRPRRRHGVRREARPLAHRGLLRRRRRDLSRASTVGTFGDLATVSFYPAHHITMGEGGCGADRPAACCKKLVESFRDWGRDCWCEPGKDNTCGKRFDWQLGDLPHGYDHKYTYSHIGYNLKLTDMQAAVGVAQLGKLDGFVAARRAQLRRLCERARRPRGVLRPARGDARLGAELVRLPARRSGPRRRSARRELVDYLDDAEDRHAPALRAATCCASRPTRTSSTARSATWPTPTSS